MEINGRTRLLGLVGNPVEHTVSPVIHNTLSQRLGYNECYVPFHVETGRLEDGIRGAFALNVLGMNVTVPYKSDVIPFLVEMDDLAEKIGACNTLVRKETGYKGYNTDMPGLYRAMVSDGISLKGEDVLILGAGGVARAVTFMCAVHEVNSITILNRSVDKAQRVLSEVREKTGFQNIRVFSNDSLKEALDRNYLAIQCTNVGMYPKVDEVVISDKAMYEHIHTGYDLIFNPRETLFMKKVKECGKEAYDGLKMLLFQGIIAYELWNEVKVSDEDAMVVFEKMQEAMRG